MELGVWIRSLCVVGMWMSCAVLREKLAHSACLTNYGDTEHLQVAAKGVDKAWSKTIIIVGVPRMVSRPRPAHQVLSRRLERPPLLLHLRPRCVAAQQSISQYYRTLAVVYNIYNFIYCFYSIIEKRLDTRNLHENEYYTIKLPS